MLLPFPEFQVPFIVNTLWDALLDLDDLTASTNSIMTLLSSLLTYPQVQQCRYITGTFTWGKTGDVVSKPQVGMSSHDCTRVKLGQLVAVLKMHLFQKAFSVLWSDWLLHS